ncbi:hypothetical protein ABZ942_23905 [Nocardia sp. NPDC046473]|uniref:hypothetical protein n=1 Tax=Nocardia sp. NPDC046473 TaxID=3155733 RepID=UPI0033FD4F78
MNRLAVKVCAALAITAAIGIGAGPAGANPGLPLEPAGDTSMGQVDAPVLVPDSGSAGPYNAFMCYLHTISAQAPCMYS